MSKYEKLLIQILKGDSDSNVSFDELCNVRDIILKYNLGGSFNA